MKNSNASVPTGILAIERDPNLIRVLSSGQFARSADWRPAIEGNALDFLRRYQGVDGEMWPEDETAYGITLVDGLASLSQIEACRHYRQSIERKHEVDLFVIGPLAQPQLMNAMFCGFDVGWVHAEHGSFSALLHECLLGQYEQLRKFGGTLNEHLLFPQCKLASDFLNIRNFLIDQGADLEAYEGVQPISVYKL